MSVREQLHKLVDELPEGRWTEALQLLEHLRLGNGGDWDNEPLSPETLAAVEQGLEDIKAGRTITLEELERKYGL